MQTKDRSAEAERATTQLYGAETEVELVCELRATKGQVWFDANSLRLSRVK